MIGSVFFLPNRKWDVSQSILGNPATCWSSPMDSTVKKWWFLMNTARQANVFFDSLSMFKFNQHQIWVKPVSKFC